MLLVLWLRFLRAGLQMFVRVLANNSPSNWRTHADPERVLCGFQFPGPSYAPDATLPEDFQPTACNLFNDLRRLRRPLAVPAVL